MKQALSDLSAWMHRRWLRGLTPLLGAGLFLLALGVLAKATRDHVRHADRYTIAFTEIDCNPPHGLDRRDFLAEVQYLAGMPDRLRFLDDDLAARLAAAFILHPRVEKVERVEIEPPTRVRVTLMHTTGGKSPRSR